MVSKVSFKVGNGRKVKSWFDKCGNEPLIFSFPSLSNVATHKDAWVADMWSPLEGGY